MNPNSIPFTAVGPRAQSCYPYEGLPRIRGEPPHEWR
jgi:hypothetical protein